MDLLTLPMPATVPPAAPLAMPTQDLDQPAVARRASPLSWRVLSARLLTFGGTIVVTAWGTAEMAAVVGSDSITRSEWLFVGLFTITFCWIALTACSALSSVFFASPTRCIGLRRQLEKRHALIMPVYNEDPAKTSAALETMAKALIAADVADHFEIFILSDTADASVWVAETACVDTLRQRIGNALPVWYRRRTDNAARKSGNVRDFVERWGARYESMLILDADSLLRADTVIELALALEADESLGILQSVPVLAGGQGLFARLQQFAGSVYGPVIARGLAAWQGDDGNYWGHNAMIRLRAFAASSGLPELPGRRPLGGHILSHDFVEAALVRKAGWRVCMLPDLEGSWESSPPSLLDVASRDRRWAQGNIQHLALVTKRGFAWPNRMHFIIGVMSYVVSPLWLGLIVSGLWLSIQAALVQHDYFPYGASLFPHWPSFDSERMQALFAYTLIVLLVPKVIGIVRVMLNARRVRLYGGHLKFLVSVIAELFASVLYAPILMLIQSRQIWEIVRGKDSGWDAQSRSGSGLPWRIACRNHAWHTAIGIAILVVLIALEPHMLPWMAPIGLGLVLSMPLSRWSASEVAGQWLKVHRVLLTPNEATPPHEFCQSQITAEMYRNEIASLCIEDVLANPMARARHARNLLPPGARSRGDPNVHWLVAHSKVLDAETLDEALAWLSPPELMQVLGDTRLLTMLAGRTAA